MQLEEAVEATNQMMVDAVASSVDVLQEASRHIISAGGKRLRPKVMFLSYTAAGGNDLSKVVPLAAALELLHTATLVHDDINDRAKKRRGKETVNYRWGETFALLTGDFLFIKFYELLAPYAHLNITMAQATVDLIEGETMQAVAVKEKTLNQETYQAIIGKKTASLFRAASKIGAQFAGADQRTVDALDEYGFRLGQAFQVVDDLLDLTGDSQTTGKDTDLDLVQGKGVGVAISSGVTNGAAVAAAPVAEMEEEEEDSYAAMKRKLVSTGAVDKARALAALLASQAEHALDQLEPSPAVDELRLLVGSTIERKS